jgi:hypothetical protein
VTTRLRVRVHPRARRDALCGFLEDGAFKLEVSAPPEAGRANRAVIAALAAALGLKKSQVSVVQGLSSRDKVVQVETLSEAQVSERLVAALTDEGPRGGP